jgi:hypothetical protein
MILDVGPFWCGVGEGSRREDFVLSWEDRSRSRFVIVKVTLL